MIEVVFNPKPHIAIEKSTAPIHLGEYLTTFLSMEIVIYNCVFSKDPQSILHAIPCLVVKKTCAIIVGLSFVFRTRLSNIGFQYGVSISLAYSFPFSRLSFVCL
jgi:hypothetical protein